jgi:hypothetical protein
VVYSSSDGDLVEVSSCNVGPLNRSKVKSVARLIASPTSKALTAWADRERDTTHEAVTETAENSIVGVSNEKVHYCCLITLQKKISAP